MNKTYFYIVGISCVVLIGGGIFALSQNNRAVAPSPSQNLKSVYYDSVAGDINTAQITYTSFEPAYQETKVSLKEKANQTKENADLISYEIETNSAKNINIEIDTDKHRLFVKGLRPKTKVSILKNNKYIMSNIPADWSGKLALTKDNIQIDKNLCVELTNKNIKACYAQEEQIGGVI